MGFPPTATLRLRVICPPSRRSNATLPLGSLFRASSFPEASDTKIQQPSADGSAWNGKSPGRLTHATASGAGWLQESGGAVTACVASQRATHALKRAKVVYHLTAAFVRVTRSRRFQARSMFQPKDNDRVLRRDVVGIIAGGNSDILVPVYLVRDQSASETARIQIVSIQEGTSFGVED